MQLRKHLATWVMVIPVSLSKLVRSEGTGLVCRAADNHSASRKRTSLRCQLHSSFPLANGTTEKGREKVENEKVEKRKAIIFKDWNAIII